MTTPEFAEVVDRIEDGRFRVPEAGVLTKREGNHFDGPVAGVYPCLSLNRSTTLSSPGSKIPLTSPRMGSGICLWKACAIPPII